MKKAIYFMRLVFLVCLMITLNKESYSQTPARTKAITTIQDSLPDNNTKAITPSRLRYTLFRMLDATKDSVPIIQMINLQKNIANGLAGLDGAGKILVSQLPTETDPTVPAWVKAITQTDTSHWHQAFSWGNHALAGYLVPIITSPTEGQVLKYISGAWRNSSASSSPDSTTAANGLNLVGKQVQLGGPIITPTTVGAGAERLDFNLGRSLFQVVDTLVLRSNATAAQIALMPNQISVNGNFLIQDNLYVFNKADFGSSSQPMKIPVMTGEPLSGASNGDMLYNSTISEFRIYQAGAWRSLFTAGDAAADGVTKGIATFTPNDFNSTGGLISLDYANMQVANGSVPGIINNTQYAILNQNFANTDLTAPSNRYHSFSGHDLVIDSTDDTEIYGRRVRLFTLPIATTTKLDMAADSLTISRPNNTTLDFRLRPLPQTVDTTTFKPIAINALGQVYRFPGWPGGGGGGGTPTLDQVLAAGSSTSANRTITHDGHNFGWHGTTAGFGIFKSFTDYTNGFHYFGYKPSDGAGDSTMLRISSEDGEVMLASVSGALVGRVFSQATAAVMEVQNSTHHSLVNVNANTSTMRTTNDGTGISHGITTYPDSLVIKGLNASTETTNLYFKGLPQSASGSDSVLVKDGTNKIFSRSQSAILSPLTASNGITRSTNDFKLGGAITGLTQWSGTDSSHRFAYNGTAYSGTSLFLVRDTSLRNGSFASAAIEGRSFGPSTSGVRGMDSSNISSGGYGVYGQSNRGAGLYGYGTGNGSYGAWVGTTGTNGYGAFIYSTTNSIALGVTGGQDTAQKAAVDITYNTTQTNAGGRIYKAINIYRTGNAPNHGQGSYIGWEGVNYAEGGAPATPFTRDYGQLVFKRQNMDGPDANSQFEFWTMQDSILKKAFVMDQGSMEFSQYGLGTYTGTAAYNLAVTSAGKVIEVATGGGGPSAGNPTASVGLTAVNGSASTFMRSDAAPPIDQSIAPTWTGAHSFTAATTGTVPTLGIKNSSPVFDLWNTAVVSSNQHRWGMQVGTSGGPFMLRAYDDDGSTGNSSVAMQIFRNGSQVTDVELKANNINLLTLSSGSGGTVTFGTMAGTGTRSLQVNSSGVLSAGPILASGTWTPTLTGVANVDGTPTLLHSTYSRVGNIVHCQVTVSVDPTANTTQTEVGITLPVASAFTGSNDASGQGAGSTGNGKANYVQVISDDTNDRATLIFESASTSASIITLSFQYTVL